jgi:acyl-CoA synthetase (AMP-forming)/AMP-acid ligase II
MMHGAVPLLHDYLIHSASRLGEKVALVCGGQRVTYGELDVRSNAVANHLAEAGVARGDRVMIFADNTVETVVAFWAVLKANAVVCIVNPLTKSDKLGYLLNDCRPTALITDRHLHSIFSEPARNCPSLLRVIVSMITACTSVASYLAVGEDDVILNVLPLAFDYGMYQMIMAFRTGARLVLERSFAFPAQILGLIKEERVTGFPGVPTIFAALSELKSLKDHDFSSIRYVTNTEAALPLKHILMLQDLFSGARIYSMYGLTECKRCTYLPPEDLERKPLSVGIAIPNTEMWIVDEDDRRVGPDVVGQLVIRGATVMKGYWGKPEATARKLKPGPLPGEQVLYTGDYCRMDVEGYLYFVGRGDEIIKSRGEKVAPKEVENVLMDIPGVREAAVIGVPDELLGQAVKAFVVMEQGRMISEKQLQKECQKRLENFMVPKSIVVVPSLPMTDTGKLKKTALS